MLGKSRGTMLSTRQAPEKKIIQRGTKGGPSKCVLHQFPIQNQQQRIMKTISLQLHNRTSFSWGKWLKVTLQKCVPKKFPLVNVGLSRGSSLQRPGSEDPHRCDRHWSNRSACDQWSNFGRQRFFGIFVQVACMRCTELSFARATK